MDPVGNLEIFFLGWPPQGGGIILEKLKKFNFPHMDQGEGRNPFAAPFTAPFAQFFFWGGDLDTFLKRQVSELASQRVRSSQQPASFFIKNRSDFAIIWRTLVDFRTRPSEVKHIEQLSCDSVPQSSFPRCKRPHTHTHTHTHTQQGRKKWKQTITHSSNLRPDTDAPSVPGATSTYFHLPNTYIAIKTKVSK